MAARKTTTVEETTDAQPSADQLRQEEIARKDAEVMQGGPGSETPPPAEPVKPQVSEITINGRKFAVDPDLAQTLAQRDRDFDRKLNEHAAELGELRKLKQQFQPPQPEQPKGYDTLLFENPTEAVTRLKNEIRQEYTQEKELERWRNRFYTRTGLDEDEDGPLVMAVYNQNAATLAPLGLSDEAIDKLGDMVNQRILGYSRKAKLEDEPTDKNAPRTQVEPASRPRTPVRTPQPEEEGPATITDLLKARRAARAKGRAA